MSAARAVWKYFPHPAKLPGNRLRVSSLILNLLGERHDLVRTARVHINIISGKGQGQVVSAASEYSVLIDLDASS
jgi:hypothetical protein